TADIASKEAAAIMLHARIGFSNLKSIFIIDLQKKRTECIYHLWASPYGSVHRGIKFLALKRVQIHKGISNFYCPPVLH
ncbi:hypothetical protein ACO0LF_31445, partial [Undibacterium sp. Di27W]|uniref:hypothetical protein n=1 Tax=Undibacterium sp. Di27W TaxID=3413036 RepID=UPI003BF20C88